MLSASLLLAPGASADGPADAFPGLPDEADFGTCRAREASGPASDASGGRVDANVAFVDLDRKASEDNQSVEEYCASRTHPGAPEVNPGDDWIPDGTPTGPPEGTPGEPEHPGDGWVPEEPGPSPPEDPRPEEPDHPGPR